MMLSHAGLMLFLFSLALLFAKRASVQMLKGSKSAPDRIHSRTVTLQAGGDDDRRDISLWMRVTVTLAVLASALFIVLSKHYEADQQKWAFGVVGTVLGYWLKP